MVFSLRLEEYLVLGLSAEAGLSQVFSVAGSDAWQYFTHSGTSLIIVVSHLTLCWFYQLFML